MTQPLTENSPAAVLFENALRAAFNDGWTQGGREYTTNRGGLPWSDSVTKRDAPARLAAEHERLVAERTAELEARVKALEDQVYVPGVWKCDACGCGLVSTFIDATNGNMGPNNREETCPNNCGPMRRKTEREAGNELVDVCENADARIRRLEEALSEIQTITTGTFASRVNEIARATLENRDE